MISVESIVLCLRKMVLMLRGEGGWYHTVEGGVGIRVIPLSVSWCCILSQITNIFSIVLFSLFPIPIYTSSI